MKQDEISQYNENEIPDNLTFPLEVNERDFSLVDGKLLPLSSANFFKTAYERIMNLRKLYFICKVVNGEIYLFDGKVFKPSLFQRDTEDGSLTIKFVPVNQVENEVRDYEDSLIDKVSNVVRGRGRPKKVLENA